MKIADFRHGIFLPIGDTPIAELTLNVNGVKRLLKLKLESYNPCGSLKDRVAVALINGVAPDVDPAVGIIESTSGNLGVAMAAICYQFGIKFNAVVDPLASSLLVDQMRRLGAQVTIVDDPDPHGGYLLNRIHYVGQQLVARPGLVWTNQYENAANPAAHYESTAPELRRQVPGTATLLVPVSTGGTLAGLVRFARGGGLPWRLIGVDVVGSAALGAPPGQRLLPGIGASQRSRFLNPADVESVHVDPTEAVAACLWLSDRAGVDVGGSSGAAVAAALRLLSSEPDLDEVVCVCPDGRDRYLHTVYHPGWRRERGITDDYADGKADLIQVRFVPGS
jgi:N-(2-amino-2-carboxyethyl)-L-glutamate synthase